MVGCGNRNIIETQRLKWQSCSGKFCFPHTFSTFSWGKSPKLRSESFLDECGIVIQIEFSRLTTVQNKECFTWIKTCVKSLEISLEFVIEEAPFQKYVDVRVQHAIQNKNWVEKVNLLNWLYNLTVAHFSKSCGCSWGLKPRYVAHHVCCPLVFLVTVRKSKVRNQCSYSTSVLSNCGHTVNVPVMMRCEKQREPVIILIEISCTCVRYIVINTISHQCSLTASVPYVRIHCDCILYLYCRF